MKVVFLTPSNVAGGAERVLTSLANQFAKSEVDTYLVQFDKDSDFYSLDKAAHKVSLGIDARNRKGFRKRMLFPEYFLHLKRTLQQINPDVVISFLFLTNVVGVICCKSLKIPIILSERNDPNEYSGKQKMVMRLLYPFANGFVCQSNTVKEYIHKRYGIKNAAVIANPLNCMQVGQIKPEKKDAVIAVGRLIPQKNFELLIDSFAEVANDFPSYSLTIFGEGPLRKELEEQVKSFGLEERIKLPGIIKDAIKINNDAKIFVLSSKFEGYPNVLAEAMANGMICIASDVASGTVRQLISNGVNGFIYPVGDQDALVELLRTTMCSEEDFCVIGDNAARLFDTIRIDRIAKQWIDYVENVFL